MEGNVGIAFLLTAIAGLATGIGGAIAIFAKRTNATFLSVSLGLSAGVMIYVSFVELLHHARINLAKALGASAGDWAAAGAFFGGIALIALIDRMVPSYENPHEVRGVESLENPDPAHAQKMKRLGVMTALAIGIHNFPEGMAVFAGSLSDLTTGVSITVAIAIHNIPEGISVAIPLYHATGSRKKAFWYSTLSGAAEPVGAIVGYLVLRPFFSDTLFGVIYASVAGIMVFISLDELLPAAKEYGKGHAAIYGLIGGMAIMALSMLLGG